MKFILESLVSSEGERFVTLNIECYPPGHALAGYPTIQTVEIDPPRAIPTGRMYDVMSFTDQSLRLANGGQRTQKVRNVFFYADYMDYPGGLGQSVGDAYLMNRDETSANYWNVVPFNAGVSRGLWTEDRLNHEILHTLGAVTWDHPLSTGGFHCLVQTDVMCYRDTGPRGHLYPLISPPECPYYGTYGRRIDCLESIYFRADHGDGTFLDWWLDEKWNTIGAENRFFNAYPEWDYSVPCSRC